MRRLWLLLLGLGTAAAAQPGSDPAPYYPPARTGPAVLRARFVAQLGAIRRDAIAQQAADGGTLAADHRAALQARIARVEQAYRDRMRNDDPFSVREDGSPIG